MDARISMLQPRHMIHAVLSSRRAALVAAAGGALVGLWAAVGDPVQLGSLMVVAVLAGAILASPELGVMAFIAAASLLPFAVIPTRMAFNPTLIDVIVTSLLASWLLRVLLTRHLPEGSALDSAILLYLGLAVVSFTLGLTYQISPERFRLFLKSINSTLLFFSVLNCVRSVGQLRRAIAALLWAGTAAAAVALIILYLPEEMATGALSSLGFLGYPTGPGVLRPIADSDVLRAIGTSVDPNVLGGLLMMTASLLFAQLASASPVLPKRTLALMLPPLLAALLLTHSRSALGGFVVAAFAIAVLRDRRLLLALLAGVLAVLLLPQSRLLVERLVSGVTFQDRAALMRLDEYHNALTTVARYPWFGIGFGNTPSIDLFLGVSSMYLLIGQEMGLLGLGAFLLVLALQAWHLGQAWVRSRTDDEKSLLATVAAPLLAAAAAGLLDHYYVNIVFPHMVGLFWLHMGLATVASRRKEDSRAVPRPPSSPKHRQ